MISKLFSQHIVETQRDTLEVHTVNIITDMLANSNWLFCNEPTLTPKKGRGLLIFLLITSRFDMYFSSGVWFQAAGIERFTAIITYHTNNVHGRWRYASMLKDEQSR